MDTTDPHAAAAQSLRVTMQRCVRGLIAELEREGRAQLRTAEVLRERAREAGLA